MTTAAAAADDDDDELQYYNMLYYYYCYYCAPEVCDKNDGRDSRSRVGSAKIEIMPLATTVAFIFNNANNRRVLYYKRGQPCGRQWFVFSHYYIYRMTIFGVH